MYFANMFCYGRDNNCVGITGIVGCMGVIYKGLGTLYAVHIPDNSQWNAKGGEVLADFVLNNENNPGKGEMFVFLNGTNRPNAEDEVKAIYFKLKKPATTLCRIMKNLGEKSGGNFADSVAIVVRQIIGGLQQLYKPDAQCGWKDGGSPETGQYRANDAFKGNKVPKDLEPEWSPNGWYPVDEKNCTVKKLWWLW